MLIQFKNFYYNFKKLFSNSREITDGEAERVDKKSSRAIRLATLEVIRLYSEHCSNDLLVEYSKLAVQRIQNDGTTKSSEKVISTFLPSNIHKMLILWIFQLLLMDILVALCRALDVISLHEIFNSCVKIWFQSNEASIQKKAYRFLKDTVYHSFYEHFDLTCRRSFNFICNFLYFIKY